MSPSQATFIEATLSKFSIAEKVAQMLCPNSTNISNEALDELLESYPVGSIFLGKMQKDRVQEVSERIRQNAQSPTLLTADLVNGIGARIYGGMLFPWQAAVGSANSEEYAEIVGEATAHEGRMIGFHWTLAPVVDLNINKDCASIYARSYGENPDHVLRMSRAFIKGVQKDGRMAATAKHFPGDGYDDRDPHLSLPTNSLSREEWFQLYGKVWQGVIADGVDTIMPGHIGLPFIDPGEPNSEPPPATYSAKILNDFLRDELNFKGLIVSDAMNMAAATAICPSEERAVRAIQSGVDVVLFSTIERDFNAIMQAVEKGDISEARIDDSVRRILELKTKVGLFEEEPSIELTDSDRTRYQATIDAISERSMTVLRNRDNVLPLNLKENAKVLTVTIQFEDIQLRGTIQNLNEIDEALKERGFEVDHLETPSAQELCDIHQNYDAVFINFHMPPNYGTSRLYIKQFQTLRMSFWPDHPAVVFTSFCDPYKIYEVNYARTMVNAYANNPESQRAVVEVWLGEAEAMGKNPVKLEGYFDMEV